MECDFAHENAVLKPTGRKRLAPALPSRPTVKPQASPADGPKSITRFNSEGQADLKDRSSRDGHAVRQSIPTHELDDFTAVELWGA